MAIGGWWTYVRQLVKHCVEAFIRRRVNVTLVCLWVHNLSSYAYLTYGPGFTRLTIVYWTMLALIYGLNCSRRLMILSYYLGLGFTSVPHKQCLWWICRAWYSVEEWIPSPVRIISNLAHPRKEIITTKKSIYSVKLLYFNQNSRKKIKSNTSSKIQKGN